MNIPTHIELEQSLHRPTQRNKVHTECTYTRVRELYVSHDRTNRFTSSPRGRSTHTHTQTNWIMAIHSNVVLVIMMDAKDEPLGLDQLGAKDRIDKIRGRHWFSPDGNDCGGRQDYRGR